MIKFFLAMLFVFFADFCFAAANFSIDLQNVDLAEAVRLMAKAAKRNVIIDNTVQGIATLQLQNADPNQALATLLKAHSLAKTVEGNIWFIAPEEELLKREQRHLKWQETQLEVAPLNTQIFKIRYAKATELGKLLQDEAGAFLSKRGHIRIDARTNAICVEDVGERIQRAGQLIKKLDVPVQQIVIAARLASVDSACEQELGINFSTRSKWLSEGAANTTKPLLRHAGYYSIAVAKLADGSLLDVKLSALESSGHAKLISSPSLFTANQETASIEAGEEVPYQETSESGGTAVVFKKAVLGLKVTPQVLPGNKVLLQLKINQDRPSNKMVLGMPTISTRQIVTNILVKNGQTIVLGGVYETDDENGREQVPFLSRIPGVGWLFKQTITRESRRELLIFVTPTIIA